MKKLFSLIALFTLICMLASCGVDTDDDDDDRDRDDDKHFVTTEKTHPTDDNTQPSEADDIIDTGEKFVGPVKKGTPFSEGLAIVTDGKRTCCINTKGYIVFDLDVEFDPSQVGAYTRGYQNGFVLINGSLYDKQGNETKPEDVGVTSFSDYALSAGYLVVYKEESTYNSTCKQIGIMDTNFEWIVPLSEELYEKDPYMAQNGLGTYVADGYIIDPSSNVFDITSATYYEWEDVPDSVGEHGWTHYSDGSFRKDYETIIFTVEGGKAREHWVDGKHLIVFYNSDAQKIFFTVVDTTGAFEFEPVAVNLPYNPYGYDWIYDGRFIIAEDGENIFICDTETNTVNQSNGSIVSEFNDVSFNDNILSVFKYNFYGSGMVYYYDMEFNPLF